ncbi:helix-turn-helix domain-containing protein [Paludibacterium purpuratum]|nr:helix-turn-helix transcriptional regulator [Paludibacterium purpuratum]
MSGFQDRFRIEKAKLRLSAKDIARQVGVCQQTVYDWLAARQHPRMHHLSSLAALLNVSADYLLYGTHDSQRQQLLQDLSATLPQLSTYQITILLHAALEFRRRERQNP